MIIVRWTISALTQLWDVLADWVGAFALSALIIELYVFMVLIALGVIRP